MDVQRWARATLEQAARHELAVGHEQSPSGWNSAIAACLGRAQPGWGHERQSRGAPPRRRVIPVAEAAARGAVGAADDEQVVGEVREPFEERDAERAAAQERDPAEHWVRPPPLSHLVRGLTDPDSSSSDSR